MFILHYMCNETQSNLAGQGCVLTCDQATAVGLECAGHWLLTFGSVGRPCAERYQCSTPAHARGAAWCCALGWSWRFWIHADTWIHLVHWSLNVVDVIGPMTGYDRDIDCHWKAAVWRQECDMNVICLCLIHICSYIFIGSYARENWTPI